MAKPEDKKRIRWTMLGLAAIVAATLVADALYTRFDARTLVGHDSYYVNFAALRPRAMPEEPGRATGAPPVADSDYPGVNILLAALDAAAGMSPALYRLTAWGLFAVLVTGCFALGSALAGPGAGLAAAWLAATTPLFLAMSRQYYVSFQAAGFLLWSAAAVVWLSRGPWRRAWVATMGATWGLAMSIHPSGLLYGAVSFAGLAWVAIRRPGPKARWAAPADIGLAAVAAAVAGAPFLVRLGAYLGQKPGLRQDGSLTWAAVTRLWSHHLAGVETFTLAMLAAGGAAVGWHVWRGRRRAETYVAVGALAAAIWLTQVLSARGAFGFGYPHALVMTAAAAALVGLLPAGRRRWWWAAPVVVAMVATGAWRMQTSLAVHDPESSPWLGPETGRFFVSVCPDVLDETAAALARGARREIVADVRRTVTNAAGEIETETDPQASSFTGAMALETAIRGGRFLRMLGQPGEGGEPDLTVVYGTADREETARVLRARRREAAARGQTCGFRVGRVACVGSPAFEQSTPGDAFVVWCGAP